MQGEQVTVYLELSESVQAQVARIRRLMNRLLKWFQDPKSRGTSSPVD